MFFKHLAKTVLNTRNRSIRIVFQYKFTIKPVIFWLLNSQEYWKISQEVRDLIMIWDARMRIRAQTAICDSRQKTTTKKKRRAFLNLGSRWEAQVINITTELMVGCVKFSLSHKLKTSAEQHKFSQKNLWFKLFKRKMIEFCKQRRNDNLQVLKLMRNY